MLCSPSPVQFRETFKLPKPSLRQSYPMQLSSRLSKLNGCSTNPAIEGMSIQDVIEGAKLNVVVELQWNHRQYKGAHETN